MTIEGNLFLNWSFEDYTGTGATTNWSDLTETRTAGAGAATVEAYTTDKVFGAACCHLAGTAADSLASVATTDYITVTNTKHYMVRFDDYKLSGTGNYLTCTIKQYKGTSTDLSDDIVITPSGSAAWATSRTVIHAAGDGGNDFHAECTKIKITFVVTGAAASWLIEGVCVAPIESSASGAFGTRIFANGYPLAELTAIGGPSMSTDTIDVTSHDSDDAFREFIAGVHDGGEISIEGNLIPTDTNGQIAFKTDFQAGTERQFYIILPNDLAEWSFEGFGTGFEPTAPYDDKLSFSATIKVTGKSTLTSSAF